MGSHFWEKEGVEAEGTQEYQDSDVDAIESQEPKKEQAKKNASSRKDTKKKISLHFKDLKTSLKRVATGVEGLDDLIEGGIKRNSVVLVEGGAGSGKSIFCMQYLVNGIEMFGESGVYISFEEEKEEVYENMLRFGWDLQKYEDEGKFIYLRYNPEQIEKILSGGGGLIRDAIEKISARRIIIDSMTAFIMLHENELAKREATLSLFRVMKKWGCTSLVVGQPDQFTSDYAGGFDVLEFECDGVIRLYNTREHNIRSRSLEVLKMRGTRHASKTFTLEITDDGVVVYPDENTF